ncbi:hypothetical protein [Pseudoalteromonas luteoviolacea]|uniref:Uncharacterized protein n=1 Tax=Pseudoalteromonas luteoviolacea S4054 TaxID=1129367 RepID=A0A0F6A7S8_9GAMM|nr:hypothetical protein [Pseudoalteromonas luteoviolacea]AOT11127.1 hypothetical protein S4054249_25170 [Pseudoalteromonas luteoviolacea]AOT15709.1 hypothetical protein S40542_23340 [Pseudoalteromonas luteoviolacea]AOT20948.1 hypothetical protein S4054_25090 [Pseudoalteromonas luteoviolacea]KKE82230.1 hypothetical protein N479_19220 [Pseudoalteromonas luteoviolacea S4054]KZN65437.1 hypothetical protein N481_25110 [Pseudoalteromonas luteoviolacea S4047-1]
MDQKFIEQIKYEERDSQSCEYAESNKHYINATLLLDESNASDEDRIKLLTQLNLYRHSASIEIEEVADGVFNMRFALLN